tara:strand:+ start:596 stop:862 length:267 start_codon:yes stop_codon:yes gene_type:complete
MTKEITPEILDILKRDANNNLTDVQRTYLLSEQGWTIEDYEEGKEHIIRTVYGAHKGRALRLLSLSILLFTIGFLVNIFIITLWTVGK